MREQVRDLAPRFGDRFDGCQRRRGLFEALLGRGGSSGPRERCINGSTRLGVRVSDDLSAHLRHPARVPAGSRTSRSALSTRDERPIAALPAGVGRDKRGGFVATAYFALKSRYLGSFERVADAAIAVGQVQAAARDTASAAGLRAAMDAVREVRAWAKALSRKRIARVGRPNRRSTERMGVRLEQGRFRAYIRLDGRTQLLGGYDDARLAGLARDRAVLHLGLDLPLNFPRRARQLGPCAPAELQRQARLEAKAAATSRFFGVTANRQAEGWDAAVTLGRRRHYIARYPTQADAARAHDRAALRLLGPGARLNFPDESPKPATIEALRKEASRERPQKHSSALHGVQKATRASKLCWIAGIVVGPRHIPLGSWPTERQAALAHDRAALFVGGPRRKLNHPRAARALGALSPKDLRAAAHRIYKQTTSSRFRGVHWSTKEATWVARIGHRGRGIRLSTFRDEERAAEAYDEAARRLHKTRATLNFPE